MIRFIRSKVNERVIYMPTSGGGGSGSVGGSGGGGFSGGGFNSGGFSNDSFNDVNRYNGTYHRYYRYGRGGGSNNNPDPRKGARAILIFIVILVVAGFLTTTGFLDDDFPSDNDTSFYYDDDDYQNYDFDVVESVKDKLNESLCVKTGKYVYNKAPNDIKLDMAKIKKSFGKFYDVTGVEPCLYVTDETIDDLESYAYDKYVELFEDEGHLLIVLNVDNDLYYYELMIGDDAKEAILDDDACEALRSDFDAMGEEVEETDDGYDYTDAVCKALTASIDEVMTNYDYVLKPTKPNTEPSSVPDTEPNTEPSVTEPETDNSDANTNSGNSKVAVIIFVALLVAVIIAFVVFWIHQAAMKRKNALLDDYSSDRTDTDHSLDDYDDQFKKRESKYDDFYKRK